MPQMMPLSWLTLFIFFMMIFMLFNIMNYFTKIMVNNINNKMKLNSKSLMWKW
uniref:ATP synthase F0 subunit 8 n=1 Tax=Allacta hainanensis TaxID=3037030 RepID=UPI0027A79CF2|nr:ATP synthase F0 subunit 8 [Allacta hainanensis]WGO56992.1 ATP synthase F0 subunit 8 [Allacta hainanensis]